MSKYDCFDCGGTGWIEVHSAEGTYTRSCPKCLGYRKKRITIELEEYDRLNQKAATKGMVDNGEVTE